MSFSTHQVDAFTIYTHDNPARPFRMVVWALENTLMIIQPPHFPDVFVWHQTLKHDFPHHELRYVWLLECTPHSIHTLSQWLNVAPKLSIVTSKNIKNTLLESALDLTFHTLDKTPFAKKTHHWVRLQADLLPSLGAHALYFPKPKLLLTGTVLSQPSTDNDKDALKAYHEQQFSHSDVLKPLLKTLKGLDVSMCVTTMGPLYDTSSYQIAIVTLMQHTFYPRHFIVEATHKNQRRYDYEALAQQTLLNLVPRYGDAFLANHFKEHNLFFEEGTLELKNAPLQGHKLWHYLFQIIDLSLGQEALQLLEPFVKKMQKTYHVPLPNAYRSLKHQFDLSLAEKDAQNQDLAFSLTTLQAKLDETQNKLLRDPLTNRFNSLFFERFLDDRKNDDWHVFVVSIDRFNVLNQRLGLQGANEVLKTLSYLIEETLPEDCVIFKYTGTQFAVWLPLEHALNVCAERLRNAVRESTLFVDTIDVNIAGVSLTELREVPRQAFTMPRLYKLLNARVLKAQNDGPGAIVTDGDTSLIPTHKTVLIVDEDDVNLRLLTRFLERTEFKVISCKSVEEALDRLSRVPVDVVISELNLAKLDGFALKQKLNAEASLAVIPFIIASHNKNERTLTRAYDLNVDAVLQKPLYLEEVYGLIKRLTRGQQR